ncbi:hypothetical protein EFJ96_15235 [Escherichia coli]|nr:hypothetical protein [Escherichia coli]
MLLLFQSLLRRGLLVAINFSPKVGEILECNFGNYPVSQNGQFSTTYYNGRIPPEMIKNRLVVVLNGKINGNACIVVPLSMDLPLYFQTPVIT